MNPFSGHISEKIRYKIIHLRKEGESERKRSKKKKNESQNKDEKIINRKKENRTANNHLEDLVETKTDHLR